MSAQLFETDRLIVRQFTPRDAAALAAVCADPQVMRYVGDGNPLSRAEVEQWIAICRQKYAERGYGAAAVIEKTTNRLIGYCGVIRAPGNDFDELIYGFDRTAWGQGYATEAGRAMIAYVFERSTLDRIYATIHPDNQPSIKVVEKLGFCFERQTRDEDGTPVAYYVIAREA